ncbi:uncharacterized protein RBU33_026128 isoform 1-T2 [Hipposideros larvatus]
MEEAVSKCLLKKFGRSVPLPLSHFTDSSRLFSHSTGIAPVHGALLASAKLLERPVYTCCLPSSPPISSSTHCFLNSVLGRTALTQVDPGGSGDWGRRLTGWEAKERLPSPLPRRSQAGLAAAPQACGFSHTFLSSLMPMSHLFLPKTKLQVDPRHRHSGCDLARLAEGLDGRGGRAPPMTTALDLALPPDGHLASHLSPCLSPPSWFGTKPSPGILRGKGPQTLDPSTLHL